MDTSYISTVAIDVRRAELDPYRIAHHANYGVWAEVGVRDWLAHAPLFPADRPVSHFSCKYVRSAREGDTITLRTRLKKPTPEGENGPAVFLQEFLVGQTLIAKSEASFGTEETP